MRVPALACLLVAGSLGLLGCSPERATEAVTERAVIATYAAGENTPDVPVFTADISGDASVEMPPGVIEYREVGETTVGGEAIPAHRVLVISAEHEDRTYELRLVFGADVVVGAHPIVGGAYEPMNTPFSAALIDYPTGGGRDDAGAIHYNNAVEGGLSFDRVGDIITGSFEFTAEATTVVDGEEVMRSITAAGTFDEIALVAETPDATEAPAG